MGTVEKRAYTKHNFVPGKKIGKVTLVKKLPLMLGDYSPRWVCVCDCGNETEKTEIVLRSPEVVNRCDECYRRAQRAYAKLLYTLGLVDKPASRKKANKPEQGDSQE